EVMGLAVLPARLKDEMSNLETAILNGYDIRNDEVLSKHADWVDEIIKKYNNINKDNIDLIIKKEIGIVFSKVLEHAGVFKRNVEGISAFLKFAGSIK
ncbi:MAG: galactose-1-phosphate uridylyltransferase, partial [Clostridia bacterium]|nr:galactose-1-phosphate uridylyltransferase [Clostridia bacterium]